MNRQTVLPVDLSVKVGASLFDRYRMSLPRNPTSSPIVRDSHQSCSSTTHVLRCARLSGVGRSAIGVIGLAGDGAGECLARLFRPVRQRPLAPAQIRYGSWLGAGMEDPQPIAGESVIVLRTAATQYEIHCHGGHAAIERIMDDLVACGAAAVDSYELAIFDFAMTQPDAVDDPVAQRMVAEACDVLTRCSTAATAAIALDQVRGALVRWRSDNLQRLQHDGTTSIEIAKQASRLVTAGRVGARLDRPFDVVLAGPPNVGKSSLINAIVGYDRSITMDLAGTTRDVLDAETAIDGWPIRMRDTAGLHESDHVIERQGIERAMQAIASADLVILVTEPRLRNDRSVPEGVRKHHPQATILEVINKSDLSSKPIVDGIATVATSGKGIAELMDAIVMTIVCDAVRPGEPIPINQRQLDWVRAIRDCKHDRSTMLRLLSEG